MRKRDAGVCSLVAALLIPVACLIACRVTIPRSASAPALPEAGNADLMEYIGQQPLLTAEPAYRAVYILWKGEVFEGDFAALADLLAENRIVDPGWNYGPDTAVDRGAVGYMVCRAARVRGGINWTLTGLGRYAYRELIHHEIAAPAGEFNLITGGEFLGILARAETYLQQREKLPTPKVELGEEPTSGS